MVDAAGFGMSAGINIVTCFVFVILFFILRPRFPSVYTPRFLNINRFPTTPPPPPVSSSNLEFLKKIITMNQSEYLRYCGLDAYMYLEFFRLSIRLFGVIAILGVGLLIPLNYTANGGVDDFESLSLSNIPSGSHRLWAHLGCAYIFYGLFYFLTWKLWQQYVNLRLTFLAERHLQEQNLSVLVQNLPSSIKSDRALFEAYDRIFPNHVHSAQLACDSTELKKAVDERDECLTKLEHALVVYAQNPTKKPQAATKCFCCGKVDAIEHYTSELERLNTEVAAKNKSVTKYTSSGFVTFNSVSAFSNANNTEINQIPFQFTSKPAPEPHDVYWPSLKITAWSRLIRSILIPIAVFFLVFFWIIPVAFVQSIATLKNLESKVPFLSPIIDLSPAVTGIIEGYLPSLVLAIFNFLLPLILLKMSQVQGIEANSWLQFSVIKKFYIFQLFNTFLISAIASSIFDQIGDLIDDPTSIPTILGQTIPQSATFFITYLLVSSLTILPGQLLNIGGVVVYAAKRRFLIKTWREKDSLYTAEGYNYGKNVPIHLLAFTISISFMVIAPIVSPFAVLYNMIAYSIYKYQFVYVWFTRFETGGVVWETLFNRLCVSTFVSQLILIGVFGLKKQPGGTILLIPLAFMTPIFYYAIGRAYENKCTLLPRSYVIEVDSILHQRLEGESQQHESKPFAPTSTTPTITNENNISAINDVESEKADSVPVLEKGASSLPLRPSTNITIDSSLSEPLLGSNLQSLGVRADFLSASRGRFAMPVYRQLEFAVDNRVEPPVTADGLEESAISFAQMQANDGKLSRSQTWADVERGQGGLLGNEVLGHIQVKSPTHSNANA